MALENTLMFVDGGYLSKISKYLGKGKHHKLNLLKFGIYLSRKQQLYCEEIFYYTAPPFQSEQPTGEEIKRKIGYDFFTNKLQKFKQINVREGRLQKIGNNFTQKGVDTLMTIDLLIEPIRRGIKTIILIACDTDFVPVLNMLRKRYNMKIILYYFTDNKRNSLFSMSNHILTACDQKVLLTEEDFLKNIIDK